jgi:hypothetical protein
VLFKELLAGAACTWLAKATVPAKTKADTNKGAVNFIITPAAKAVKFMSDVIVVGTGQCPLPTYSDSAGCLSHPDIFKILN